MCVKLQYNVDGVFDLNVTKTYHSVYKETVSYKGKIL